MWDALGLSSSKRSNARSVRLPGRCWKVWAPLWTFLGVSGISSNRKQGMAVRKHPILATKRFWFLAVE